MQSAVAGGQGEALETKRRKEKMQPQIREMAEGADTQALACADRQSVAAQVLLEGDTVT